MVCLLLFISHSSSYQNFKIFLYTVFAHFLFAVHFILQEKWGYNEGGGLGTDLQGQVSPVQAFLQIGRWGFGYVDMVLCTFPIYARKLSEYLTLALQE